MTLSAAMLADLGLRHVTISGCETMDACEAATVGLGPATGAPGKHQRKEAA
jgi:hypothetical protein